MSNKEIILGAQKQIIDIVTKFLNKEISRAEVEKQAYEIAAKFNRELEIDEYNREYSYEYMKSRFEDVNDTTWLNLRSSNSIVAYYEYDEERDEELEDEE